MKKLMRTTNFTLIELLVVIARIAILAGMLLPALNSAREKGRSSDCIGKRKQVDQGLKAYIGDYDDYMPPAADKSNPSFTEYWTLKLYRLSYFSRTNTTILEAQQEELFKRLYSCSTVMSTNGSTKINSSVLSITLAGDTGNMRFTKSSMVKNPSTLFVHTADVGNYYPARRHVNTRPCLTRWTSLKGYGASNQYFVSYWGIHTGKGNSVFYDGHIASQTENEQDQEIHWSKSMHRTPANYVAN